MKTGIFTSLYAAAMCIVAAAFAFFNPHDTFTNLANLWLFAVGPATGYVVLAVAQVTARKIRPLFKDLLVLVGLAHFVFWEREIVELRFHPEASLIGFLLLVVGAWELATRTDPPSRLDGVKRIMRRIMHPQVLMVAGAVMVLISLVLPVALGLANTDNRVSGLEVLVHESRWITSDVGLPSAILGHTTPQLAPIFAVSGYAFYLVTVLVSLMTLALPIGRFLRYVHATPRRLGAAALLCGGWAATDLFWGWHFELNSIPWTVYVGFACWLGSLAYAAVNTVRIVRGESDSSAPFILFQIPLIAFNCAMLPAYWQGDIRLSGLGVLFLGAQAQAWGWASLLMKEGDSVRQ